MSLPKRFLDSGSFADMPKKKKCNNKCRKGGNAGEMVEDNLRAELLCVELLSWRYIF